MLFEINWYIVWSSIKQQREFAMFAIKKITSLGSFFLFFLFSSVSHAALIEFHFTGQLTVIYANGALVDQAPIDSTFSYDTNLGVGSGALVVSPISFLGNSLSFHDISMQRVNEGNGNLMLGNMLADFGPSLDIPFSTVWDATGLINAIGFGLQAGDVISGSTMKRGGAFYADVGSATPASDGLFNPNTGGNLNQGPAPLATTTLNTTTLCTPGIDCMGNPFSGGVGFTDDGISGSPMVDGPFPTLNASLDLGSGNSLTVISVTAVPVPAAVWLFISGFLGLLAVARRKRI